VALERFFDRHLPTSYNDESRLVRAGPPELVS
jgi:hypothetical protein